MLGTILFVDETTGTAIIRADDGKRYRFPLTDWPTNAALAAGVRVDFDADGDRALSPLPITDEVVNAVSAVMTTTAAAPSVAPEPQLAASSEPAPEPEPEAEPAVEPAMEPMPSEIAETDIGQNAGAVDDEMTPAEIPAPTPYPAEPRPLAPGIAAMDDADSTPLGRPLSAAGDEVPEYLGLSEPDAKAGGMSGIFVVGGVVLLLALAALAYMMWDNAESAGQTASVSEEGGVSISLVAQEDLPVRNVAAMTNATVLGRIARGDRVTGVEVPGSADPQSRWLRIDGGNRYVPMTGLGPSAPPALPAAPVAPVPAAPPIAPDDGSFERQFGGQGGDYRADQNGPVDAVPRPNRPAPPVRPAPPPVRPSPPPQRQVTPSRPQETRPVAPQRPIAPQRGTDPRETQPVGR